ncbi:sphingomyelin phosphodiesterase-like protein [Leptotrombidium deliense]|uniref:Sphingomyelin phosphodiesterase-like protein n=1 Tax=Leptotrombidium deliense TaxID=299467 RepID=A0A443RSQ9_9ACAR|nr:sphingomyelin phosphodiesterase-like protein [Leptotrombidium deliense]
MKILHISDIHYDPYYEPGSVVNCAGKICCRRESNSLNNNESDGSAGYWGELWSSDYKKGVCGTPLQIIEKTLEHISKTQKIDVVFWTGDNARHMPISSSELIFQTTKTITELLHIYFKNVAVFPSLGNHDGLPNSHLA